jgi:hypothetical protein
MSETSDFFTILLAIAVIALFALFFGFVIYRFVSYGKLLAGMIEGSAERQRAQPAITGRDTETPLWKRLIQILLIGALLALLWLKFRGI